MTSAAASSRLCAFAAASLALGSGVYVFVRSAQAWFVPSLLHQPGLSCDTLSAVSGSLPTAAHVFAWSVLTAAFVRAPRHRTIDAPLFWVLVNVAFELGQHPAVASKIAAQIGDSVIWPLRHLRSYFLHGTFDALDVLAACAGGALACLLLAKSHEGKLHAAS